jgi:hypothetical protein
MSSYKVQRDLDNHPEDLVIEAIASKCKYNDAFHRKLFMAIYPLEKLNGINIRPSVSSSDQQNASKKRKLDDTAAEPASPARRGYHTIAEWSNCGEGFSTEDTLLDVCQYHSGTLDERSDDEFGDRDDAEDDGVKVDSLEHYLWSCCDQTSETKGCEKRLGHSTGEPNEQARLAPEGLELSVESSVVVDCGTGTRDHDWEDSVARDLSSDYY